MLSAVLHGKKLGTGFAGTRLKIGETQGAEDVLTASVFERIAYLPDEVFISFAKKLFDDRMDIGALDDIVFWPGWQSRSVEPDVILKCGGQNIIVEAKRYDNFQQQYPKQLAREIITAYEIGITKPILLTVGGMSDYRPQSIANLKAQIDNALNQPLDYAFYAVSWQELYYNLQLAIDEMSSSPLNRLLSDIREAYAWHGIRHQPRQWLRELKPTNITYEKMPKIQSSRNAWTKIYPVNLNYETFPSFIGV